MHGIITLSQFGVNRLHIVKIEKLGKYFQTINDSGNQLLNLINNLLDLSKLEANKWELALFKNSLLSLAEICISEQTALLNKRGLNAEILPSECDGLGYFDKDQIHQVISNLLSNAIKFSDEGSTIQILIEEDADALSPNNTKSKISTLQFSIINEGIALTADDFELMFEQFAQSKETKNIGGGTGLGLSICREIIEKHRGAITAVKNPNAEGVKVVFTLPNHSEISKGDSDE